MGGGKFSLRGVVYGKSPIFFLTKVPKGRLGVRGGVGENIVEAKRASVGMRLVSDFPGRPCRIFSSRSVARLTTDVRTGNLLGPVVIHDGTSNQCRLVSNRHEGETCRVLGVGGVHTVVISMDSSRTVVVVMSDGYRHSGVLPDRGTFSCGVGLSTVGERKGHGSLLIRCVSVVCHNSWLPM